ncbi:MAG: cation-translocating P-type ATPase, partial [Oscillospiraceae bacterium]|nr:cation-translocating P-type ATPase [Oscillospiraceae bacterium]
MTQYDVRGMSCAACSARVEKAVRAVPGVEDCAVSLLTNSMGVEGSAPPEAVIAAVSGAGYGASLKAQPGAASAPADALADRETPALLRRLLISLGFLLALMYLSMGHMMWGWPLPAFLAGNHVGVGLAELLLSAAVLVVNRRFFQSGFRALVKRAPNMDSLVALGASASFGWSVAMLFVMTEAQRRGDASAMQGAMG